MKYVAPIDPEEVKETQKEMDPIIEEINRKTSEQMEKLREEAKKYAKS